MISLVRVGGGTWYSLLNSNKIPYRLLTFYYTFPLEVGPIGIVNLSNQLQKRKGRYGVSVILIPNFDSYFCSIE